MIRDEIRRLRNSLHNTSSLDKVSYITLVFIALMIIGGLINLPAISETFKLILFITVVAIITGATICIYYHQRSIAPPTETESKETPQRLAPRDIPPKPTTPPTMASENKSSAQPAATNITVELSSDPPPRRRLRRRKNFREVVTESNVHWLVIHTYSRISQGLFKRSLWKHKTHKVELDDNPDVNIRLATKIPTNPTDGETKIYYLQRLHWLSHGPAQVGIAAGTLLMMWLVSAESIQNGGSNLPVGSLLIVTAAGSSWYYYVWIRWAYTFLIFTNLKIRMPYRPPFNLPRRTPSTDLLELKGGTDPSSGILGNIFGFGSIRTETIATVVDQWLIKSVRYVKNYERAALLLEQLRENVVKLYQGG